MSDIITTKKSEVSRAPIDYFSWGHLNMGVVVFLLWSMVNLLPSLYNQEMTYILAYGISVLLTVVVAVVWEIVENTLLLNIGIKFEGRKDSLQNAIWDIIFVVVGGLIMWAIKSLMINLTGNYALIPAFYIVGVIVFIAFLIGFFIGKSITK